MILSRSVVWCATNVVKTNTDSISQTSRRPKRINRVSLCWLWDIVYVLVIPRRHDVSSTPLHTMVAMNSTTPTWLAWHPCPYDSRGSKIHLCPETFTMRIQNVYFMNRHKRNMQSRIWYFPVFFCFAFGTGQCYLYSTGSLICADAIMIGPALVQQH